MVADCAGCVQREGQEAAEAQQAPQPDFTRRALLATAQDAAAPTQWTGACSAPIVGVKISNLGQVKVSGLTTVPSQPPTGIVYVAIAVASNGTIAQSVIVGPSGTPALDDATLKAVQGASYQPAQYNCQPIDNLLIYKAEYKTR